MIAILSRTLFRLKPSYYFKNVVFSLALTGSFFFLLFTRDVLFIVPPVYLVLMVVNALLFPYSFFVYEVVVERFVGNKIGVTTASVYFFFKLIVMLLCYVFAFYISPLGLIYLYVRYGAVSQRQRIQEQSAGGEL